MVIRASWPRQLAGSVAIALVAWQCGGKTSAVSSSDASIEREGGSAEGTTGSSGGSSGSASGSSGSSSRSSTIADAGPISCSVDSDCGNPYLACAPAPVSQCVPSYQLPCKTSSDCGPAGFTCNPNAGTNCSAAGCMPVARCESQYTLCSSDSECPAGWSCYAPPGGVAPPPGGPRTSDPMACYPPFASFNGAAAQPQ
jgi:hypothetical protein